MIVNRAFCNNNKEHNKIYTELKNFLYFGLNARGMKNQMQLFFIKLFMKNHYKIRNKKMQYEKFEIV